MLSYSSLISVSFLDINKPNIAEILNNNHGINPYVPLSSSPAIFLPIGNKLDTNYHWEEDIQI
jgi:hypothetical protein